MYRSPSDDYRDPPTPAPTSATPSSGAVPGSPSSEEIAVAIGKVIASLPELLRQLGRSAIAANRIANEYENIVRTLRAHGLVIPEIDLRFFFQRCDVQTLARFTVQTGILDLADTALAGINLG
jgi:hypothetical protein